ncbi:type I-E CRISPR-associated protein Cas6/Cse3/CasE [Micromonospora craniellae]|uniref:Type I-E CRISPR-associated protein Cas6/Cse3/CasE n=1 Tax=Micromonospora craniellae TaxID=2294034 RepID=A0A372FRJ3_9ACTN|nr:type I-E CRISPR-associated protein Cas6/Cse3/CasE [Micromonospora craniellae]QOC92368.1 type I-E CRISPR-associated protein Cas6/Cse3/CasE [Micromonospora craniellae]RFS43375.1 type I-E CRISPR-associated protein Cas6/Cse3/CasE [Micromonospora craniellae]
MYLSKLTVNVYSRDFRRDHADLRQMHRTVMSGWPDLADEGPARQSQAVLWRLDTVHRGFVQYVQSNSKPDWSRLTADYLTEPAQVRSLQPLLDAITPGRRFAFRLVGNPTRSVIRPATATQSPVEGGKRPRGKRIARHKPEEQIEWLIRKGNQHGFVVPTAHNGQPDVSPSPCLPQAGQARPGDRGPITVMPVRFEGHLIVTDADAFRTAVRQGIGHGKAYGCGLISLAPARTP